MEINGTIRDASFYHGDAEPYRSPCIRGAVYGDTKGRFVDGERITTSRIQEVYASGDGAVIVMTRFSAYRVEFAALPEPKASMLFDPGCDVGGGP